MSQKETWRSWLTIRYLSLYFLKGLFGDRLKAWVNIFSHITFIIVIRVASGLTADTLYYYHALLHGTTSEQCWYCLRFLSCRYFHKISINWTIWFLIVSIVAKKHDSLDNQASLLDMYFLSEINNCRVSKQHLTHFFYRDLHHWRYPYVLVP